MATIFRDEYITVATDICPPTGALPAVVQNRMNELTAAGAFSMAAGKDHVYTSGATTTFRITYKVNCTGPAPDRNEWLAD